MHSLSTPPLAAQRRVPKFKRRPELLPHREITARSLDVIATINRYRFLSTTLLCHLLPGNHRITKRHLQALYHQDLINRFVFPKVGTPGEFHYYLDNRRALDLLVEHGHTDAKSLDYGQVSGNRKKDYAHIHQSQEDIGQAFLFLTHEMALSRFHAMLELGARASGGEIVLAQWYQGQVLCQSVTVPQVVFDPDRGRRGEWIELKETEKLPHRPDAFFTLQFPKLEPEDQFQHFFYEYERGTATTKKVNKKLRAHFHFIAVQKRHKEIYKTHRIRAVLVETPEERWAETLRHHAGHKTAGPSKPTELFWFTHSGHFIEPVQIITGSKKPKVVLASRFLDDPMQVFQRVWKTPSGERVFSLLDF